MYEMDDVVTIFPTGRIGEMAVKMGDGWVYYSTENWNAPAKSLDKYKQIMDDIWTNSKDR